MNQTIRWFEEKLQDKNATEFREHGLSVGTLRYIKAALIHAAWYREKEIAESAQATWPSAVIQALRKKVELLQKSADRFTVEPAPILDELRAEYAPSKNSASTEDWDAFVSHASEDKEAFVRPLAVALRNRKLRIWYDDFTLTVGDSLRRSIDRGLAHSRFGIVVLSPSFFAKEWPQKELDGLVAREAHGQKVILPVWHDVDAETIREFSPLLADRVAVSSAVGIEAVVQALITAMSGNKLKHVSNRLPAKKEKPLSLSADSILQLIGDSTPADWTYYDPQAKYYFNNNVQLTIDRHPAQDNQFAEPWAHRFPDQSAHAVKFTIYYGATPIKDFWAVEVDGGRSYIPYPKSAEVLTINRWEYTVGKIINIANGTNSFEDYFRRARFSVVNE